MRFTILALVTLVMFGNSVYGQDMSMNDSPDDNSVWMPSKVDWQVVRAKKSKENKDICIVRWIYDKSATLSFVKNGDVYKFIMDFNDLKDVPLISGGETYYGILSKQDDSITQITIDVIDEKTLSIIDPVATEISAFRPSEKISIFFEEKIYNFPVANALENFDAYEKCQQTLDMPKKTVQETLQVAKVEGAPVKDLHERARDHLTSIKERSVVPPNLPAFRMSNTKAEIMEKYRKMESESSDASGGMNQNLIRKLQILEVEKEELRRKLLTLTQESYIPGLIACEPSAGPENDEILSQGMKDSYLATIEALRAENRELQQAVDSCVDCL